MSVAWVAVGTAVLSAGTQIYTNRQEKKAMEEYNKHGRESSQSSVPTIWPMLQNPTAFFLTDILMDYSRGARTAEAQGWKRGNDGKWYDRQGNVVKRPGSTSWQSYGEFMRAGMTMERATAQASSAWRAGQPTWDEMQQRWTPGTGGGHVDPDTWNSLDRNGRMQLMNQYNLDENGVLISNLPDPTQQEIVGEDEPMAPMVDIPADAMHIPQDIPQGEDERITSDPNAFDPTTNAGAPALNQRDYGATSGLGGSGRQGSFSFTGYGG